MMMRKKDEHMPLVSIVVLTYLQRHILNECVDLILEQDYPNIEIVVCDDSSADFDCDEVRDYLAQHKKDNVSNIVVYKHKHNVGTVMNAQKGVELSSGSFFKLHAGDDMLYQKDSISRAMKYFDDSQTMIIAGLARACQHDGTLTDHYYPSYEARRLMKAADAYHQFEMMGTQSWGEYINAPSVYWRRDFFNQMGGFDPRYKYTEDWPMWIKITKSGTKITIVDEIFTVYRYGGISNDQSTLNLDIGKQHYEECVRMLKDEVLPVFKTNTMRKKIFRCKHCIRILEIRRETEGIWENWNTLEKIYWRLKNIPFLLTAWAYRKRKHGLTINKKKIAAVAVLFLILYAFHVRAYPLGEIDAVWAKAFFVVVAWLVFQVRLTICMRIINKVLDLQKRN